MDGWITIGTELSTDKFDKQIMELERKIEKEERKSEAKLNIKTQAEQELEEQRQKVEELGKQYDKLRIAKQRAGEIRQRVEAGESVSAVERLDFKTYSSMASQMGAVGNEFDKALAKQEKLELKAQKLSDAYKEITNNVTQYRNKISQIEMQKQLAEAERAKTSFKGWGEALSTAVTKITRIGLAVFSVRSAYSAIRQTISTLSQYDDGLAQKLEAIKLTLASALAPVVEFIVNLITKAVALLGYVLKTLFGIDIFAKASAMSMKKATSSARELRKQLAGFDEMNVLNDSGTSGVLGGLGTTIQDMSEMGEGVFKDLRKWFLGSDKEDFWGIWNDNMEIIKNFDQDVRKTLKPLADWIYKNAFEPIKDNFEIVMKKLEPLIEPVKNAFLKVVEEVKPYWESFVGFVKKDVVDPATEAFRPIGVRIHNFLVPWANKIIDLINNLFGAFGVHLEHWEYETEEAGENVGENLTNPLEQTENKIDELNQNEVNIQTDTTNVENLNNGVGGILDKLWELVSKPWKIVTSIVTEGSRSLNNFLQPLREGLSNIGIQLPFLATGGIINMPNRGTMIGGAMAGESGREGVIPLTDSQAMADLGREIGKNVMVNLTNITSMNGRIISRELKQVQNEQEFAYNM